MSRQCVVPAGSGCHHPDLVHCPSADWPSVSCYFPPCADICAPPQVRLHAILLALPSARPHHRLHQRLLCVHQGVPYTRHGYMQYAFRTLLLTVLWLSSVHVHVMLVRSR